MTNNSPLDIFNIGQLSEPFTKLIEVVSHHIGIRHEPDRIIREAKAQSIADIIKANTDEEITLRKIRMNMAIEDMQYERQVNKENIVKATIPMLPDTVSKEKVDKDWTTEFFNYSQDISNQEMQALWARILAGEISEPGAYSLRTLSTLKILQSRDAMVLNLLSNYLWQDPLSLDYLYIYNKKIEDYILKQGLSYSHFLHLESLNLINIEPFLSRIVISNRNYFLSYGKQKALQISFADENAENKKSFQAYVMSSVGNELASLCTPQIDEVYYSMTLEYLHDVGLDVIEGTINQSENKFYYEEK